MSRFTASIITLLWACTSACAQMYGNLAFDSLDSEMNLNVSNRIQWHIIANIEGAITGFSFDLALSTGSGHAGVIDGSRTWTLVQNLDSNLGFYDIPPIWIPEQGNYSLFAEGPGGRSVSDEFHVSDWTENNATTASWKRTSVSATSIPSPSTSVPPSSSVAPSKSQIHLLEVLLPVLIAAFWVGIVVWHLYRTRWRKKAPESRYEPAFPLRNLLRRRGEERASEDLPRYQNDDSRTEGRTAEHGSRADLGASNPVSPPAYQL